MAKPKTKGKKAGDDSLVEAGPFKPIGENQETYHRLIDTCTVTFGVGPAGVGKTMVPAAYAANKLVSDGGYRLIVARPLVTAGKGVGHLPGTLEDKTAPYLKPVMGILSRQLGPVMLKHCLDKGRITGVPIEFMLGETYDNTMILVDEAQNTDCEQMELILTRIGQDSKVVLTGDYKRQKFIHCKSGLQDAEERLKHIKGVGIVHFNIDDCQRHDIVKDIMYAYYEEGHAGKPAGTPKEKVVAHPPERGRADEGIPMQKPET